MVVDPQTEWAHRLIDSLVEAGVRQAVISPGSRSTPLSWAALKARALCCRCLIDERSAAFFALGQARLSGVPSLLICTSGTAAANYFPAVIEAALSHVPLLVISADRPFELQHCGASQTINQTRLFGDYAAFYELGTPSAAPEALGALRRTARQAVEEAHAGPVHLNFRAHKPLEPRADRALVALPSLGHAPVMSRRRAPAVLAADADLLAERLRASDCPVLMAGSMALRDAPPSAVVAAFLARTGSLLVPEAASQLRFALAPGVAEGSVCDAFDWLVGDAQFSRRVRPDFVLHLGAPPLSTAAQTFLKQRRESLAYAVCAREGWPDPVHQSAQIVRADAGELLVALAERFATPRAQSAEQHSLLHANQLAWQTIDEQLAGGFDEAVAVRVLYDALPAASVLAVGNSLPPRHLDRYCRALPRGIRLCSQRGAAGIEGGIAAALGAATQAECPTTLLVGDVAALHDVGSLWAADDARCLGPPRRYPLLIVVLNNGGGRIFEQLPLARQGFTPLELWTSPHQLSFEHAARLYGVEYARLSSKSGLEQALREAYSRPRVTLLEVQVASDNALVRQDALAAELRSRLEAWVARAP